MLDFNPHLLAYPEVLGIAIRPLRVGLILNQIYDTILRLTGDDLTDRITNMLAANYPRV